MFFKNKILYLYNYSIESASMFAAGPKAGLAEVIHEIGQFGPPTAQARDLLCGMFGPDPRLAEISQFGSEELAQTIGGFFVRECSPPERSDDTAAVRAASAMQLYVRGQSLGYIAAQFYNGSPSHAQTALDAVTIGVAERGLASDDLLGNLINKLAQEREAQITGDTAYIPDADDFASSPARHVAARADDGKTGAWWKKALCRDADTRLFYSRAPAAIEAARRLCASCDVRAECLEYALPRKTEPGVWGGMTEDERRQEKRRRSNRRAKSAYRARQRSS